MPRKENTKAKTWERDRRERMNSYFNTLGDLLPTLQEGRKRNKVDILIHAAKYIRELHGRMEELFFVHASDAHKEELARLKKLVTQLFSRTQLLSTLLKEAGVTIPAEPPLEKISVLKWSNEINVEDNEKLFTKVEGKKKARKKREKIVRKKVPSKKKTRTPPQSTSKKLSNGCVVSENSDNTIENQENCANSVNDENKVSGDVGTTGTSPVGPTPMTAPCINNPNKKPQSKHNVMQPNNNVHFKADLTADAMTTEPLNRNRSKVIRKLETHKKVKRKSKANGKNKIPVCISQPVTNLAPGTLILSSGKIMPVVTPITPLTSNIIVNGQPQPTNPIILRNGQPNQMIVMQHLPNHAQSSVIPVCNQALLNTVQKVTLNTVPSIQTNMMVNSQDWVSNVKSIIDATKIGGRKGILPKGREITKTTMAYKVPIPAVHREKVEKTKEVNNRKETDVKSKIKHNTKSTNNRQASPSRKSTHKGNKAASNDQMSDNCKSNAEVSLKRINSDCTNSEERNSKRAKVEETSTPSENYRNTQPNNSRLTELPSTCKSIESLRHVIEKMGEDMNETHLKQNVSSAQIEGEADEGKDTKTDGKVASNEENCTRHPIIARKQEDYDKVCSHPENGAQVSKCSNSGQSDCGTVKQSNETAPFNADKQSLTVDDKPTKLSFSDELSIPEDPCSIQSQKPDLSLSKVADPELSSPLKTTETEVDAVDIIKKTSTERVKAVCNLGTRFDSLLQANVKRPETLESLTTLENSKIILNLDTNTTTTVKPESTILVKPAISSTIPGQDATGGSKLGSFSKDDTLKSLSYSADNSFIPINRSEALHSDLSNDIFASLQVPSSSHHPESISPTAAFLMAFPLVSSLNGKTEVLEEEMKEDFKYHSQTPPMLLQIGAMEPNSFKIKMTAPTVSTKENVVRSHEVSVDVEKNRNAQKYLKSSNDEGKDNSVSTKVLGNQSENKVDQNINGSSQVTQYKVDLQPRNNTQQLEQSKALPKIVNNEPLKESYKIVQTSVPAVTSSLAYTTSVSSALPYSTTATIASGPNHIQSAPGVHSRTMDINAQTVVGQPNPIISPMKYNNPVSHPLTTPTTESNTSFPTHTAVPMKYNDLVRNSSTVPTAVTNSTFQSQTEPHSSISAPTAKYDLCPQYAGTQNFMPNYPNISGNVELPHYTTPTFTSSVQTSSQNPLGGQITNVTVNVLQAPMSSQSETKNVHSSQNLQHCYTVHNKDPVSTVRNLQHSYAAQNKDAVPAWSQNLQQRYTGQNKDSLPPQTLQHGYSIQIKDPSLPTSSQTLQHRFVSQNKDSPPASSQNLQHGYSNQMKDSIPTSAQNLQHAYPAQNKDSHPSPSQNIQHNYPTLNKEALPTSSQNIHHAYPVRNKDSHPSLPLNLQHNFPTKTKDAHPSLNADQNAKLTDNLHAKQQNQDHRHENYPAKKVETENFGQNFTYGKDAMTNQQNQVSTVNPNVAMFEGKNTTVQSYIPYSKDSKKIVPTMAPVTSGSKPLLQNTVNYSQNSSQIVTSNFEQSTITENNMKSTTTVAHNSSNFSILSWTTFSPVGGNNNLVHFEQGQAVTDTAETKTICENFNYIPLHKENVGFSNMLPEGYTGDPNVNISKSRTKTVLEPQKQQFVDPAKAQNIQPSITPQKQNPNQTGDYKFSNENKNKAKYTMDANYMQSDYVSMDQQAKHQALPPKQDKSNYPMPGYNPQVTFNLSETAAQVKYSTENYTGANFKYTDKSQLSQKYQPLVQTQAPPLQHSNSAYKHSQNSNKTKPQQQAIRPPVNWMMTPEIKHNTNIADMILPPIGKELEFCQNNLFSQTATYNQSTPNQFYNNYDVAHNFPNIPVLQNEAKKVDTFYSEDQPFTWSPTKSTHVIEQSQSIKPIDQHIVPSTLPTLVGDLALGTNIPEKQNFLFGQMQSRASNEHNKDLIKDKDANTSREFHTILNPQNAQHTAQGTFLSVSQLVEHEKAEKSQQARKHQRKSTTSPRGSGKRQMDLRKQTTSTDQLHHDDQKPAEQTFSEQNYQQKYQQNDVHWRGRNCKSNYTAEALIGSNTSVQDENHQDKHASIKFAPNYGQNKFPSGLSSETMMPINYFPNADDGNNYGQVNQNFNSYAYSSNTNIYPTTNFITSISNTPTSYMMPLPENADYLETNSFLLPNVSTANPTKTQHYTGKHPNCDSKRSYSASKKSKRKTDNMAQNIEFPISGINSPLEDYHSTFLPHANLYQNPPQANIYPKAVNPNLAGNQNVIPPTALPMNPNITRGTASNSPMVMAHPSGTSLTNFNLSTIFPEINDKVAGYKPPNSMPPGLTQPSNHGSSYSQRSNYTNTLGHPPQVSEPAQFSNNMPPPPGVHYKTT